MYIVAIAWVYVTLLMAASERSWVAGVMTFTLFGLAPLAIFLWLMGTPQRRRNALRKQSGESQVPTEGKESAPAAEDSTGECR